MVFIRLSYTAGGEELPGYNDGSIYLGNGIVPTSFTQSEQEDYYFAIFHEIGHYWDTITKNSYRTDPFWWFSKSAEFVSDYALKAPWEDWTNSFGHYFMRQMHGGDWGSTCDAKMALIASFVASLK